MYTTIYKFENVSFFDMSYKARNIRFWRIEKENGINLRLKEVVGDYIYLVMMNGEQKVRIILKHDRRKAERVSFCTGKRHMQIQ